MSAGVRVSSVRVAVVCALAFGVTLLAIAAASLRADDAMAGFLGSPTDFPPTVMLSETPTPTTPFLTTVTMAVDMDTTDETVQECAEVGVGSTTTFHVLLKDVPVNPGLGGYAGSILYDPAVIEVTAFEPVMVMQAQPSGTGIFFDDPVPDTDGDYQFNDGELGGTPESGDGIAAKVTVLAVGEGTSLLVLSDVLEGDDTANVFTPLGEYYPVTEVDGRIVVGGTCSGSTPTPTVTPTPSPTGSPTGTPTGTPSTVPDSPTPTSTSVLLRWADADCDGSLTTRDNQAVLRIVLEQNALSQTQPCPAIGSEVTVASASLAWVDADCDGAITARDSQSIMRSVLQQNPVTQIEPCPDVGDLTDVS